MYSQKNVISVFAMASPLNLLPAAHAHNICPLARISRARECKMVQLARAIVLTVYK